jgi:putative ABC transport system permease protein
MFKNYMLIAFRNLMRNKIFSLINIIGLAIGITCFLTLIIFIIDESGYDNYNENVNQIYRVVNHQKFNGQEATSAKTCPPLAESLMRDFPEVTNATRLGYFGEHNLRYGEKYFRENGIYTADSTYFDVFTLPFIYGNPKEALKRPNSVVITEKTAKKYFGSENPLGKTFIVDDKDTYIITGVMKNYPLKSSFRCAFLLSMSTYTEPQIQDWLIGGYSTYIVLKKGSDPHQFENKMKRTVLNFVGPQAASMLGFSFEEFVAAGNKYEFLLQPLSTIYLRSQSDYNIDPNTEWGNMKLSNINYTYIFLAIGIFILLIAVFNFMNLPTAKSEKRALEVGIRKTLGSDKSRLIWQFISESTLTCFLSVVLSIILTRLVLPLFNQFTGRELKLELFNNISTIPLLLLFTIFVGFLAGSYPAFYLSSFPPSHIIKRKSLYAGSKNRIKSTLVILQFAISIALVIGTIIIRNQLDYIKNKDLGFQKENIVAINNGSSLGKYLKAFQQEISRDPNVISSTASSLMFASGIPGDGYLYNKKTGTDVVGCQFLDVDYDFAKTYQLKMKSGRFFSEEFLTDSAAFVINETAVKVFKANDPIGKELTEVISSHKDMKTFKIIGVVKDFNYESLHQTVRPLILHLSPVRQASTIITVRVKTSEIANTLKSLENTWSTFVNKEKMNCSFVEENLASMYVNEEKVGTLTTIFSFLAIFIACLGLFGLVSFVTQQRFKEIGIRKVLGASVFEIVILLSKEFTMWVIYANLIAWPIAYYVMNNWLQNFAYRTNINWSVFIISGVLALIIALVTVSIQAVKAAIANPINSLKYE